MKPKTLRALYLAVALLAGLASIPAYGQAKPWLDVLIGRRLTHSGSPVTQRSNLELGSGFTVADDPANDRTVLTAPGGSGGAGALVVSTQTALRGLHAVDLTDGQQATVKATTKIWIWSSTSGAGFAGDDLTSAQLSETLTANAGRFYPQDGTAVLPTIAALRAATGSKQTTVQVQAYATLGDGGGDAFDDVAGTISASDDGGNFIVSGAHIWRRRGVPFADIRKFGAKGDTVDLTGLAIASGAFTITAGHTCVAADIGKRITITDAGADDSFGFHRPLQATVNSCSGSNTVISAPAARTVSGKTGMLFTDDRAAIKQAYTYLASLGGGTLHIPPGVFGLGKSLQIPANISIVGDGYGSALREIEGGWNITIDPDTGGVADGKGFGVLNLYNVDNVRITNLRVIGSVDTPVDVNYLLSPQGVYLASTTGTKIDHSWFEHFHYAAIFGSRIASDTNALLMQRAIVENCHFEDTAYPTAKEAVNTGNTIEMAGHGHVIKGNTFHKAGAPINMAGDHCLIEGNSGEDVIGVLIAAGDSFSVEGSGVRGNSFHTILTKDNLSNTVVVPALTGLSIQPPAGTGLPAEASDNIFHFTIAYQQATFTANAGTDTCTATAHGLVNGDVVYVKNSGGGLPAPLSAAAKYFIVNAATDTFQVSLTLGGAAINLTTAGTGTQTFAQQGMAADRAIVGMMCDLADTTFAHNAVEIEIKSSIVNPTKINGIQIQGLVPQRTYLRGNVVRVLTGNASTWSGSGFAGIVAGVQNVGTWPIFLSHNQVIGWGPGSGVAAYNIQGTHGSGFEVHVQVEGDVYDTGIATIGNTINFPNRPFYLGYDSTLPNLGVDSPMALGVMPTDPDTSSDALLFRKGGGSGDMVVGAIRDGNVSGAAAISGSKITPAFGAQDVSGQAANFTSTAQFGGAVSSTMGGNASWVLQNWTASTAYDALYFGSVTPGNGNYALAGNGSTQLNVNSGSSATGELALRAGGDQVLGIKQGTGGVHTTLVTSTGSPEGVVNQDVGSIDVDVTTPNLYIKTTALGTLTGWKLVTRAP